MPARVWFCSLPSWHDTMMTSFNLRSMVSGSSSGELGTYGGIFEDS